MDSRTALAPLGLFDHSELLLPTHGWTRLRRGGAVWQNQLFFIRKGTRERRRKEGGAGGQNLRVQGHKEKRTEAGGRGMGGDETGVCVLGDLTHNSFHMQGLLNLLHTIFAWSSIQVPPLPLQSALYLQCQQVAVKHLSSAVGDPSPSACARSA